MSRLRTYGPMKKKSEKRKKLEPDFRAVYAQVDARSEGRCEVTTGEPTFTTGFVGAWRIVTGTSRVRCPRRAVDHHHTVKPRSSHTTPEEVIAICRPCHDKTEYPYARGRLVIRPVGCGWFSCAIVTSPDKFTYRYQKGNA